MQIGAVEAGDEFEWIAEAELADDVVPDVLGGAGGKSGDGQFRKFTAQAAEEAILRAEIMAPFGDTMRFVDDEEGERERLEPAEGAFLCDGFGRQIEKAEFSG